MYFHSLGEIMFHTFLHSFFPIISRYKLIFICTGQRGRGESRWTECRINSYVCVVWDVLCRRSQINIRAVGIQALSCLSGARLWSGRWVWACRGPDPAASLPLYWAAPLACSEVSCVFICTISIVIMWYLNWGSSFFARLPQHIVLCSLNKVTMQCHIAITYTSKKKKKKNIYSVFFNLFRKIVAGDASWNEIHTGK